MDVVSVVEAVLEPPRQVLWAQQHEARGEAVAEMKADGIEYDERMVLLEEVTWPRPLAELLEATYEPYRQSHPWLDPGALEPKSVVREMWEQGMGFTDLVARYQLARSEGLVLRYLTDAYRTLRQTVPERHRSPELEELVEWLGETVRQTDSSLLDEWEALTDPAHVRADVAEHAPPPPPRPISAQTGRSGSWCATRSGAGSSWSPATTSMRSPRWRRTYAGLGGAAAGGGDVARGLGRRTGGLLRRPRRGPARRRRPRPALLAIEATGAAVAAPPDPARPGRRPRLGDRGDRSTSTPRTPRGRPWSSPPPA